MLKDCRGHALTGATETSLPLYETALRELNLFINDPVASVDKAIAENPDFVMAHASERLAMRPKSPLSRVFMRRAAELKTAA